MKELLKIASVGLVSAALYAGEPATAKDQVTPFKKASSVIGMSVTDSSGKALGKVQELVLDLDAKKVGYAVLSLQSQNGSRLVPVPMSALQPGKDHFVLNMSPAVLAAATGVKNDQWPAPDSFAVGAPAAAEQGKGSSEN